MEQRNSEAFEQANALYAEAEGILNADIEKAGAEQKTDKLAQLYYQNAQLQNKMLTPILNNAQQGLPFDTLAFCKRVDNIIASFNSSAEYNKKPNAKGKVKRRSDDFGLQQGGYSEHVDALLQLWRLYGCYG